MELHLDGTVQINASPTNVFGLLTDPNFLAKTLPDSEVRVIDGSNLEGKVKVKVAVVSSTLKIRMTVTEREPPIRAKLLVDASGSGTTMRITSSFNLVGGSTTSMTWVADAAINGLMAGLGSTVLKGFAAKKVQEIFDGITKAIEQTTGSVR